MHLLGLSLRLGLAFTPTVYAVDKTTLFVFTVCVIEEMRFQMEDVVEKQPLCTHEMAAGSCSVAQRSCNESMTETCSVWD